MNKNSGEIIVMILGGILVIGAFLGFLVMDGLSQLDMTSGYSSYSGKAYTVEEANAIRDKQIQKEKIEKKNMLLGRK